MTNALSPRDIQTRVRAGASVEQLAQASGTPADKIEPFAAPVLAEREHVAGTALQCPVRRRGESSSARSMQATVSDTLLREGIDSENVSWDAWREEDRSWTVKATWSAAEQEHEALFRFDQRGRFSVARNDEARKLIGEVTASTVRGDHDAEPTIDLNDELAIVRAVQGSAPIVPSTVRDELELKASEEQETIRLLRRNGRVEAAPSTETAEHPMAPAAEPAVDVEDLQDYAEAELEQVDGIYDIVPSTVGEMDVLYEMLSTFNEDSVNIYAGLTDPTLHPVTEARIAPSAPDEVSEPVSSAPAGLEQDKLDGLDDDSLEAEAAGEDEPAAPASLPEASPEPDEKAESVAASSDGSQQPLVEVDQEESVRTKAKPRKKRASVPSWDEIMFGGPSIK